MHNLKATRASFLKFAYCDGTGATEETVSFVVPGNLLWSSQGLAQAFDECRASYLINPGGLGFDEDCWESWHLVSAQEDTEYFMIDPTPTETGLEKGEESTDPEQSGLANQKGVS